jgi:hypothetical protein
MNNPHRYATLVERTKKDLLCLKFGIYAEDLKAFNEHIDRLGIKRVPPWMTVKRTAFGLNPATAYLFQIKVAEKSSSSSSPSRSLNPLARGFVRAASSKVDKVHPSCNMSPMC